MNESNETIAQRLRRLRTDAGKSQRELAAPGVSYAYISRIEAGQRKPSVKALRKLAAKLGVTAEYLENGENRTMTDDLLEQVLARVGAVRLLAENGEVAVVWGELDPGAAHAERFVARGVNVTEALLNVVTIEAQLEQVERQQQELEERRRELEETRTALRSDDAAVDAALAP